MIDLQSRFLIQRTNLQSSFGAGPGGVHAPKSDGGSTSGVIAPRADDSGGTGGAVAAPKSEPGATGAVHAPKAEADPGASDGAEPAPLKNPITDFFAGVERDVRRFEDKIREDTKATADAVRDLGRRPDGGCDPIAQVAGGLIEAGGNAAAGAVDAGGDALDWVGNSTGLW